MELTTTPPTAAESVASASASPRVSAGTRLLISCPDRPGIVAAVSRFLHESGANIVSSDQHTTDPRGGSFFMRMEFHLPLDGAAHAAFEQRFGNEVGVPFE